MIYSLLGFYLSWRAYDFFSEGHPRRWEVTLNRQTHSGKHPEGSPDKDIVKLVNRAIDLDVFTETDGRQYQMFNDFKRDRLKDLDISSLYKWINKNKRNIELGSSAR